MKETGITRNVIQIISRHSNWKSKSIKQQLVDRKIYADKSDWAKFIDLTLIGTGAGFSLAGIIFFLAYNWHLMHRFLKLGLIQGLVIAIVIVLLSFKLKPLVKDVLLLSASVLVGAMFSVFGQIYQTGADAYDFFLGWTVFITIWALVSNFPVLWLLFISLINITFILFVSQVGPNWPSSTTYMVLFMVNALVLLGIQWLFQKKVIDHLPIWFSRSLALSVAIYITIGLMECIFEQGSDAWPIFFALAILNYGFDIYRSFKTRSLFSLCVIPFSIIIIVCALVFEKIDIDYKAKFFLLSILVIVSITFLMRWLIKLNKTWNGAN